MRESREGRGPSSNSPRIGDVRPSCEAHGLAPEPDVQEAAGRVVALGTWALDGMLVGIVSAIADRLNRKAGWFGRRHSSRQYRPASPSAGSTWPRSRGLRPAAGCRPPASPETSTYPQS